MSEFVTIETQEQFDEAVEERVKQERESVSKEYEGYISPEDFQNKTSEYENKIKGFETQSLKNKLAHKAGLSYEAMEFIKGDDEESIKNSIETLVKLTGEKKEAPPLADTEESGKDKDEALKTMLRGLKKGE